MMKPNSAMVSLAVLLALAALTGSAATSSQSAAHSRARAVRNPGRSIDLQLTVDVSSLSRNGQAVALGGYAIAVEFDPKAVELVSVGGGEDPLFAAAPFSTAPVKANNTGHLRVVGVQSSATGPVGNVSVATVHFVEKQPGGAATIHTHLEQAASTLLRGVDGSATSMSLPVQAIEEQVSQ